MCCQKQFLGFLLLLSLPFSIAAKEIKVKDQLICAIAQAALCHENEKCTEGSANTVDLPLLVRVNLQKKIIGTTRMSGEQRSSSIQAVNTSNNNFILQGVQEGSGWNMTINKTNGQMSVSSSLDGQGYVAFGVCTHR